MSDKAKEIAETIPCQCSDCGMDESRAASMIQSYADQQLAKHREVLKELISIAENRIFVLREGDPYKIHVTEIITSAKSLLDKTGL